ncbi:MAG TPA: MFS transporter [Candidatus Binatia bacterium]|nr:MFS transporter [Candidatus Binatia bacterium]
MANPVRYSNEPPASSNGNYLHGASAAVLGWTLEAYEYFVLVFIVDALARDFHISKEAVIRTFIATLAMRPIGALLFGVLADRYGRRIPMLFMGAFFFVIAVLSGSCQNYPTFLFLRALYGIGMGGYWGVAASLALESAPGRWRGVLSGVIQAGYPLGYLLAAMTARLMLPLWGWRPMYWVGTVPAIITMFLVYKAPESQKCAGKQFRNIETVMPELWKQRWIFAYLVIALALMVSLSHGTQDLYPDFLKTQHRVSSNGTADIAMLYSIGAILGAIFVGHCSELFGRRKTIIGALGLCVLAIPAWAFGKSLFVLAAGSVVMQIGVSGAWGVMPAHLTELAPNSVRALFGGLAYQFGVLLGSPGSSIEYALKTGWGYGNALAIFESVVIATLVIVFWLGPENKGKAFSDDRPIFDLEDAAIKPATEPA